MTPLPVRRSVRSGSRVVLVPVSDDVVLRPPPPPEQVVDVAAAVRDALRFPLSGPPLETLARAADARRSSSSRRRCRCPERRRTRGRSAIAVAIAELERCGIPDERQTILVAGGLGRRFGQRDLERLLPPPQARAFRGRVVVHDAEDEALVPSGEGLASTRTSSRPTSC